MREAGDWKTSTDFLLAWTFVSRRTFTNMLNKAPKLKHTVKTKTKTNINVRPASEAMVGRRILSYWWLSALFVSHVSELSNWHISWLVWKQNDSPPFFFLRLNSWRWCFWTAWRRRRRPKLLKKNPQRLELNISDRSPRLVQRGLKSRTSLSATVVLTT